MSTTKKCAPSKKCGSCGKTKRRSAHFTEGMLQDFVQHKTSVMTIMAAVAALGALFAMMVGVSAAHL